MSNNRYQSQLHAAMSMKLNESVETEEPGMEEIVLEYLNSFFGKDITESTNSVSEEDLMEAIESLNILCGVVNEYFDID